MNEKIYVVHDRYVYNELRNQHKVNRRFGLFAILSTACIVWLAKKVISQNVETDEESGIHIDI